MKGDNMKTTYMRAVQSERMRKRNTQDCFRLKAGYLLSHEREAIIKAASQGVPFVEIALDYDCTISNICHIARKAGLRRQRARGEIR